MKSLVVYYSLSGKTKTVAEAVAKALTADIEEIQDQKDRKGLLKMVLAGLDSVLKKPTTIAATKFNPADYDLVVIGTPVWSYTMSCAVRAWLGQYGANAKKVAFFATMGGSGDVKTFKDMEALAKKAPVATLGLLDKNIKANNFQPQVDTFVAALNK